MSPLLTVRNLEISFPSGSGSSRVVDGVTFEVAEGEALWIVGESGSGKSITSLALLGMVPKPGAVSGDITFEGRDMRSLGERDLRAIRGSKLAMIFQDPMTSLNPFLPVWVQIAEVTRAHLGQSRGEARAHANDHSKLLDGAISVAAAKQDLADGVACLKVLGIQLNGFAKLRQRSFFIGLLRKLHTIVVGYCGSGFLVSSAALGIRLGGKSR